MKIFAIRDRTANIFTAVNADQSIEVAKRGFEFAVNNNEMLKFAAKDYELCMIAEFDNVSGVITPVSPIVVICRADEVMQHD